MPRAGDQPRGMGRLRAPGQTGTPRKCKVRTLQPSRWEEQSLDEGLQGREEPIPTWKPTRHQQGRGGPLWVRRSKCPQWVGLPDCTAPV